MAPASSLKIARFLMGEDKQLAIALWKHSIRDAPDQIVGIAISTGYQLGLDADPELGQLLARLDRLAAEGKEDVRVVPFEELVATPREYRDQSVKLEEAYSGGTAPVHHRGLR